MQIQLLHFAQWMAGVTASIIAGTSIMVPGFTDDNAVKQEDPKKRTKTVVRRIDRDDKVDQGIDELLKKYNIELKDSGGVQQFTIQDDSTRADIIIINRDQPDEVGMQFHFNDSLVQFHADFSDSLMRIHMPNMDSLMKEHNIVIRKFGKEFKSNFKRNWQPQMDSLMENQQFFFRNFEGKMDSAMRHFEYNFQGMDSAFKNMDFEFRIMDSVYRFNELNDSTFGSNSTFFKNSKNKKVKRIQGKSDAKGQNVFLFKNDCGSSDPGKVKLKKRIIIGDHIPQVDRLLAVERAQSMFIARPHKKNSRVIIIKKNGKNKTEAPKAEQQIAEVQEQTEIDRRKYIPGDYTDATPWDFQLSPNPTTGILNISCKLPSEETPVTIGVYDILGNAVYSRDMAAPSEFQNMQLDLSGKPTGTYLLQITQGGRSFTRKFEIQQ